MCEILMNFFGQVGLSYMYQIHIQLCSLVTWVVHTIKNQNGGNTRKMFEVLVSKGR